MDEYKDRPREEVIRMFQSELVYDFNRWSMDKKRPFIFFDQPKINTDTIKRIGLYSQEMAESMANVMGVKLKQLGEEMITSMLARLIYKALLNAEEVNSELDSDQ